MKYKDSKPGDIMISKYTTTVDITLFNIGKNHYYYKIDNNEIDIFPDNNHLIHEEWVVYRNGEKIYES